MTPEQQARVRAATHVRTAIRRAAWEFATGEPVATDGSVAGASVSFGPPFDVLDVPLCGMRAAVVAHRVAFAQMRECAEAARGASRSWDDVAAALDLPVRDGEPRAPGQVAFEWLIEGRDPESGRRACRRCRRRRSGRACRAGRG